MHTLPQLSYSFNALEPVIDAKTMEIHHDKHHNAYVVNLNKALENYPALSGFNVYELLTNLENVPTEIRQAVINNGGGHINHTLFWEILTPGGSKNPSDRLMSDIDNSFGSLEEFKAKFSEAAVKRFGSGWAWLVRNKEGVLEVCSTPNQDSPIMDGKTPILGLDVWEHAYYLNYQNRRPEYVESFFGIINWDKVEEFDL